MAFRRMALAVQTALTKSVVLQKLELKLIRDCQTEANSVFIVGAPRTGTTILYQVLLNDYHFAYLTNIASLFVRSPVTITRITEAFRKRTLMRFTSEYGYVKGFFSPSEAGATMRCWFDSECNHVAATISALSVTMQGPFLCKNLYNSQRILKIREKLSKAIFLWVIRDPLYTAQSIILARRKLYGNEEESWFSVRPKNFEQIKVLTEYEQAVYQIKNIDDSIAEEIALSGLNEKVLRVDYDEFCDNHRKVLGKIEAFLGKNGCSIVRKPDAPESAPEISLSRKRILGDEEWKKLRATVKSIYT